MGFPYPWDPSSCSCLSTLSKHIADKDPVVPLTGQVIIDVNGVAVNGVVVNGVIKSSLPLSEAPNPMEPSTTTLKKPKVPPTKEVNTPSPPETSTKPSPPDSDASSDEEERAVGVGTDLA
jgi:hypothetical protein